MRAHLEFMEFELEGVGDVVDSYTLDVTPFGAVTFHGEKLICVLWARAV